MSARIMIGSSWGKMTPRSSSSQKEMGAQPDLCNTRFSIVATELMKATEDTGVRHRLAIWSPRGRLGYDRCLVHQDILVGSVQGGEDLEPRLG
ncbi:unnamed protein product [Prunus brigantina]